MRKTIGVLLAALTAGCFTYQPLSAPYPQERTVRVDLTPRGSQLARERIGYSATDLTGQIQAASNDTLFMSVMLPGPSGMAGPVTQQIELPPLSVATVSTRRVSVLRTVFASGVAGAALYVLIVSKVLHPPPACAGSALC